MDDFYDEELEPINEVIFQKYLKKVEDIYNSNSGFDLKRKRIALVLDEAKLEDVNNRTLEKINFLRRYVKKINLKEKEFINNREIIDSNLSLIDDKKIRKEDVIIKNEILRKLALNIEILKENFDKETYKEIDNLVQEMKKSNLFSDKEKQYFEADKNKIFNEIVRNNNQKIEIIFDKFYDSDKSYIEKYIGMNKLRNDLRTNKKKFDPEFTNVPEYILKAQNLLEEYKEKAKEEITILGGNPDYIFYLKEISDLEKTNITKNLDYLKNQEPIKEKEEEQEIKDFLER